MTDVTRNATAAPSASALIRPDDGSRGYPVLLADRQTDVQLDLRRYRGLVRRVLAAEGVPPDAETAVSFVGCNEMAELNEGHMGHHGPTDVLAFPIDLAPACGAGDDGASDDGDVSYAADSLDGAPGGLLAGDVVVCPAVAATNAAAGANPRLGHDGTVTAELDLLVVHGLLHLLGMDHAEPTAAAAMRERETAHLSVLWATP